MSKHTAQFRRCLEDLDIPGAQRLWKHMFPNLPQITNPQEALISAHIARTQINAIGLAHRAWSHRWLLDHGYPSQLPDHLKPRAERMYPKIVEAVGVSINSMSKSMRPVAKKIEHAVSLAVAEAYVDGKTDVAHVRARMKDAEGKARKFYEDLLNGR